MDIISNVLTQIRNASAVNKVNCVVRHSKIVEEILRILKREGYISDYKVEEKAGKKNIRILLSYNQKFKPSITGLNRVSKPGRRLYSTAEKLPVVLGGMGTLIISTNKGLVTSKEAREQKLGGEIICEVY